MERKNETIEESYALRMSKVWDCTYDEAVDYIKWDEEQEVDPRDRLNWN